MNTAIVGFALGVWLCQQQVELVPWAIPAFAALAATVVYRSIFRIWPRLGSGVLLLAALCGGFSYATWRGNLRLAERLVEDLEGRDIAVVGVVEDLPQPMERGLRFQFGVESPPAGIPKRVSLTWYRTGKAAKVLPEIHAGERWRLTVRLRQPHGNMNPHGFDYEAWLFERGIGGLGYVRVDPGNRRLAPLAAGPGPWLDAVRESIRERFQRTLPDSPWRGVLVALVVGDQASISREQWALFSRTGVTHLMSISGLHVTLTGTIVAFCVAGLWRRSERLMLRVPVRKAALLAGAASAGFYVLLAGSGVPAQRTLYMLSAAVIALWLERNNSALRTLLLALWVVLVLDPWAVLSAGFWLSFGAVGALLLMSVAIGRSEHWLLAWFRAQWAVTLLTLPILLGLFQQFSLISPLANAIAIPLIGMIVTPLVLLFAVLPLPSLAELANGLLGGLMAFLQWCAALPAANWQQAAPPGWLVGVAVLAALWSLLPRGVPGRWVGLLAFVPLLGWMPQRPADGEMQVTILDVGQGLSVHVRTARHDLLYDAGPRYGTESDSGDRIIVPYLRAVASSHLDGMVISHDDIDHSGGADSVFAALPVNAWYSSLPKGAGLLALNEHHTACQRGQRWSWDGVRFEMLYPETNDAVDTDNDRSCVLRLVSEKGTLLLTGDIEKRAEDLLLRDNAEALRADVLVVPHHGSKSSSHADFVAAVGASTVVFTSGYRNRFHHPAPAVLARYAGTGAQLLRSDGDGAVRIAFDAGGIRVATSRTQSLRYWHDRTY